MRTDNLHSGTVAVIGNGPVGQTTALLLARWGIPVILLDGRPERDPIGSKAICQQRDVLDVWESLGVGRRIADEGVTWEIARTFHRDRELFAQPFIDHCASEFPPFVNISQTRTEQLMDETIAAHPTIDVRWDHTVVDIDQDEHEARLRCTTSTGDVTVHADYVVLAAGSRALDLRDRLGVGFPGRSFDDKFLICDIRADIPGWGNERRFYFDPEWNPGRQVLIHPCPDSTFRIDWQVPGDYDIDAEAASGALDTRIRQIIGDVDYDIVWKSVYRFHARLVRSMRVGRVLLAGDCAHIVSPFGARGLNSGVLDAENAAWKLAFVLRGWADESLLDSYDTERRGAALENLDVTAATMDFLVPQDDTAAARRLDILERAHADDDARRRVDSGRLAEPFWYNDSPLTTPHPERIFTGRPERGHVPDVVPGVLVPDAPVHLRGSDATRLRAIARDGFLLLHGDAVDPRELRDAALAATHAPVRIHAISEIDHDGVLATVLRPAPNEVWVVRPDAHVAAVSRGTGEVGTALRTVTSQPVREVAAVG